MHVAVCIVSYGGADEVARLIDGLARQTHSDFEIAICENGDDGAVARLRKSVRFALPGGQPITIVHAPDNPGYAGGVNRAMDAVPQADAWWVLNPDTAPEDGALAALISRLKRGDVVAAGGVLLKDDGRVQGHGGRWHACLARTESIGKGSSPADRPAPAAIEAKLNYLLGASMLVGRAMVDRVGRMREDYFLYCEEVEWCLRARAAGLRFGYTPDAVVHHAQGSTTGSADSIRTRPKLPIYLDERNKLNTLRDTTPGRLAIAAPAAFILLVLRYAKSCAWRQLGYAVSGWLAGLRDERDKPAWLKGR